MQRADPKKVLSHVMEDLERIKATCDIWKIEANPPHWFLVSLPDNDCFFNRTVFFDVLKLDGKTVLHAVDKETNYSAACFMDIESTKEVWEEFMRI